MKQYDIRRNVNLAYIIGVAIGDGNLSNPNGRAVRLRITCDLKYPEIIKEIGANLKKILPDNKVSLIYKTEKCCDISCYSNKWEKILSWRAKDGPKYKQKLFIPKWIKENPKYSAACLKGLLETDGSVYYDRGYKMVNFTNIIPQIIKDASEMIDELGFNAKIYKIKPLKDQTRYTIRISKDVEKFISKIKLNKK